MEKLITRDQLIDLFAAFDVSFRKQMMEQLNKVITATEIDVESGSVPPGAAEISYTNLLFMRACCEEAEAEFKGLSKRA